MKLLIQVVQMRCQINHKCEIRNPFLIAKFGSFCVSSRKIAIFSRNMYILRSISPRLSERALQK